MTGRLLEPTSIHPARDIPRPGDVLASKFLVKSIVGEGGMGVVLEVEHLELSQAMAIKLMLPAPTQDLGAAATRFVREARAAASLQSEHVVRIYDVGTLDSGLPYMVMELLRGQDLAAHLTHHGPLPVEDAVECILQACLAVAEAHGKGLVHRDLKPSNLFLTRRSDGAMLVKVLDFGISKVLATPASFVSQSLTATNVAMGSPLYMSPEQVRNAKYADVRSDIWSLGVILHELLTGAPAFQADTLPAICAAIIADPTPPLRQVLPDAPAALEEVIARCLEKDVTRRFQRIEELMSALIPLSAADPLHSVGQRLSAQHRVLSLQEEDEAAESGTGDDPTSAGRASDRPNASRPFGSPASVADTQVSSTGLTNMPRARRKAILHGLAASSAGVAFQTLQSSNPPPRGSRRKTVVLAGMVAAMVLVSGVGYVQLLRQRTPRAAVSWESTTATGTGTSLVAAQAARASANMLTSMNTGAATSTGTIPSAGPRFPLTTRTAFEVVIESNPSGADVWEGNASIGKTPLRTVVDNERVRLSPREWVLRYGGYFPYRVLQGPSDEDVHVNAFLTADPSAMAPASSQALSTPASHGGSRGKRSRDPRAAPPDPAPLHIAPTAALSAATVPPAAPEPSPSPPAISPPAAPQRSPDDIRLER